MTNELKICCLQPSRGQSEAVMVALVLVTAAAAASVAAAFGGGRADGRRLRLFLALDRDCLRLAVTCRH